MTIFTVLLPRPNEQLVDAIKAAYPDNWFSLNDTQFLVSATGTAIEVSTRIGVTDPDDRQKTIGAAVIFATTSYYGRAPTPVWDWVKAKLEGA